MTEYADQLLRLAADHRAWGYALAFAMAMAEALPVVGTVVPGSVIVIGLGALVPSGAIDLPPLLLWSILGAIGGDGGSYLLGRHFHREIGNIWPFRRYPRLMAKGEALFRSHGGMAVFASRFVQGPRAFVPLAAGMLGMPGHRFIVVNVLSALVWAPSHILLGALIGGSVALAGAVAGRLAVLLVVALVLAMLLIWGVGWSIRLIPVAWTDVQRRGLAWSRTGNGWIHRQVGALFDPERPEALALALVGVILIAAAWLFLGVLEDVATRDPLVRVDTAVFHFLQSLRTPAIDRLMIVITESGDRAVLAALGVVVALWLAGRRAWHALAYWAAGLVLASILGTLLKLALRTPRPMDIYQGWGAYSFPSGHASMSAVLWGFLAILIAREARPRWWPWIFGTGAGIVALISFSRLYLGAHWLSDVIGGLAFGTAWVAALGIAYLQHRSKVIGAKGLAAAVVLVFAVAGAWHVNDAFSGDQRRYAPKPTEITITAKDWRATAWRDLPRRRADLEGRREEPLTIQWLGDPRGLADALRAAGWSEPTAWSLGSALSWFDPRVGAAALPVIPKLHDGRFPVLTLIKTGAGVPAGAARLVVRLWNSGVAVAPPDGRALKLRVGEVVAETLSRPTNFIAITRTSHAFDAAFGRLAAALDPTLFQFRDRGAQPGWNGRLLLGGATAAR